MRRVARFRASADQGQSKPGLSGEERFDIEIGADLRPQQELIVTATDGKGKAKQFTVICRIDTPIEIEYYRNGGILHTVLRNLLKG